MKNVESVHFAFEGVYPIHSEIGIGNKKYWKYW